MNCRLPPDGGIEWPLFVLALTGLMLILDLTITNVALPAIQLALATTTLDLQWVVNAYALAGGGFLLLGGGWPTVSAGGGSSSGDGPVRRRVPGRRPCAVGRMVDRRPRRWRWVLFVNVPVAALVLAATPRLIPDDRGQPGTTTDLPGAVTVTGGLLAVVYATTQVPANGWTGSQTVGLFLLAAILLGAFVAVEARHRAPLVPLSTFRRRSLAGASAVGVLVGAGLVGPPIFFLTMYLQQILGFSALAAGLGSLPLALGVITASQVASRTVGTVGPKPLAAGGLLLSSAGLALLGRIQADGGPSHGRAAGAGRVGADDPRARTQPAGQADRAPTYGRKSIVSVFSDEELRYLLGDGRRLARLATVGRDGTPHVAPVGWSYNPDQDTIDIGGHGLEQTKKYRDVARSGRAAVVIDEVLPPWRPRGVEVRGRAQALEQPTTLIRIHPERIVSWGIHSDRLGDRNARTVGHKEL